MGITDSSFIDTSTVELTVHGPSAADIVGGLYLDDNCPDPLVGFRVRSKEVSHDGDPPDNDRTRGEIQVNDPGPNEFVDLWKDESGVLSLAADPYDTHTVQVTCDGDTDFYLATSLVFDSGFEVGLVGESSNAVACGPDACRPGRYPSDDVEADSQVGKEDQALERTSCCL